MATFSQPIFYVHKGCCRLIGLTLDPICHLLQLRMCSWLKVSWVWGGNKIILTLQIRSEPPWSWIVHNIGSDRTTQKPKRAIWPGSATKRMLHTYTGATKINNTFPTPLQLALQNVSAFSAMISSIIYSFFLPQHTMSALFLLKKNKHIVQMFHIPVQKVAVMQLELFSNRHKETEEESCKIVWESLESPLWNCFQQTASVWSYLLAKSSVSASWWL